MRTDNHAYFIRRAAEERAAAELTTCPEAAEAHREMAERYAALAELEITELKTLSA